MDGLYVAEPDADNPSFKIVCTALSLSFRRTGHEGERISHLGSWFRAAIRVISATVRYLLSSQDVKHRSSAKAAPCHDDFVVVDEVPYICGSSTFASSVVSWSNMIDSPSDCPFATSPLCSTLATVQLIIIDLLHFHFLFIVLEVLVIVLTLCVFALLLVIRRLQNSPCEPL